MYCEQLTREEAKQFEERYKDIMVYKYTFRTDPERYERDFLHHGTQYFITKYKTMRGEKIPIEITKYRGLWFHGLASSKSFIYEHLDEMDWSDISGEVKLRENFIREFKDYVNWRIICSKQKLKKSFIEEMKDYCEKYIKNVR